MRSRCPKVDSIWKTRVIQVRTPSQGHLVLLWMKMLPVSQNRGSCPTNVPCGKTAYPGDSTHMRFTHAGSKDHEQSNICLWLIYQLFLANADENEFTGYIGCFSQTEGVSKCSQMSEENISRKEAYLLAHSWGSIPSGQGSCGLASVRWLPTWNPQPGSREQRLRSLRLLSPFY